MYFRSSSQTKSPVGSSSGDRNGDGGRQNVGGPKQDNQTVSFSTKCHKTDQTKNTYKQNKSKQTKDQKKISVTNAIEDQTRKATATEIEELIASMNRSPLRRIMTGRRKKS